MSNKHAPCVVDGEYPEITTWAEYDTAKAAYIVERDEANNFAILHAIEAWEYRKLAEMRWLNENNPFHGGKTS